MVAAARPPSCLGRVPEHTQCRLLQRREQDRPGAAALALPRRGAPTPTRRRGPAPSPRLAAAPAPRRCSPPTTVAAAATPPDAADPPVAYRDTLSDRAFIALCRLSYGKLAGWQSPRAWWSDGEETYRGMVEVSRALMKKYPTAAGQRDAVIAGFPAVPPWFRRAFPYSKWGAELNARITPAFFAWLVGPAAVEDGEVDGGVVQASTVRIERCRYLAESGCVAMCANLCKAPVQTFFTRELGMPLTMTPDFETKACTMVFGATPPPLEADPCLVGAACLAECPTGRKSGGGGGGDGGASCWQLGGGSGSADGRG